MESSRSPLLEIRGLRTCFRAGRGTAAVVDGVDLAIHRGESLGLVGESGSGKTMTALSVLKLVPDPPGRIAEGRILFKNRDLLKLSAAELRRIRGNEIAMVFQEPMAAMNPVFTVGDQIAEAALVHKKMTRREAAARAVDLLARTGVPAPEKAARSYPHQLSGGMLQRAVIAMALICGPDLLIADEPTSALDVTIQSQILDLLARIREEEGMSLLLISHDFGVVAGVCDRIAVMYAAQIVEEGDAAAIFRRPRHPYTEALFKSLPSLGARQERLQAIPGAVPSPFAFPPACRFHPRCAYAEEICRRDKPALEEKAPGLRAACHFPR